MQISGVRNKMSPFQVTAEDKRNHQLWLKRKKRKEMQKTQNTMTRGYQNSYDNKCKHLTFPC